MAWKFSVVIKDPHYRKILQQSEGAQSPSPGSIAKGEQSTSDPRPHYKKKKKKSGNITRPIKKAPLQTHLAKLHFNRVTTASSKLSLKKVALCLAAEVD